MNKVEYISKCTKIIITSRAHSQHHINRHHIDALQSKRYGSDSQLLLDGTGTAVRVFRVLTREDVLLQSADADHHVCVDIHGPDFDTGQRRSVDPVPADQ